MHQYNIRTLFKRIAIDIGGSFCWSNKGHHYLVITRDCFTRWLRSYDVPSQKSMMIVEVLVTAMHHGTAFQFAQQTLQLHQVLHSTAFLEELISIGTCDPSDFTPSVA